MYMHAVPTEGHNAMYDNSNAHISDPFDNPDMAINMIG